MKINMQAETVCRSTNLTMWKNSDTALPILPTAVDFTLRRGERFAFVRLRCGCAAHLHLNTVACILVRKIASILESALPYRYYIAT